MESFLKFLEDHYIGILVLILLLFSLVLILNWLARIFSWGTFKSRQFDFASKNNFSYVITMFFVNLINDFKHFLALVIVVIFSGLIIYSMATGDKFEEKMEALQLVIASLGGLLGSIIGYYFGESAGKSVSQGNSDNTTNQNSNAPDSGQVVQAPELDLDNTNENAED